MGAPPVPEATPAVPIRDSRGADSQYLAVLMRANTHALAEALGANGVPTCYKSIIRKAVGLEC